jgi:hypothetical protein
MAAGDHVDDCRVDAHVVDDAFVEPLAEQRLMRRRVCLSGKGVLQGARRRNAVWPSAGAQEVLQRARHR